MATPMSFLIILSIVVCSLLCFSHKINGTGYLYPQFYDYSCPRAQEIVRSIVEEAVAKEARMAASLLRLHFHDCFVQGCDASILLDSSGSITSEKQAAPNNNSARGFEVIDDIKSAIEEACAARSHAPIFWLLLPEILQDLSGGHSWEVPLGRRDSKGASFNGANNDIPAPTSTLQTLTTKFKQQGLNTTDLVTLSGEPPQLTYQGSHTIGVARCTSFRQRLYNQSGNGQPDPTINESYAAHLRLGCPQSGDDNNLSPLDFVSPTKFDNYYYKNVVREKSLLNSDQVLFTKCQETMDLVKEFAENNELFLKQFAKSMIKMGNINPLTGPRGEIRKNCRKINDN